MLVFRNPRRELMLPLFYAGHILKKCWGFYYKNTKLRRIPRLGGLMARIASLNAALDARRHGVKEKERIFRMQEQCSHTAGPDEAQRRQEELELQQSMGRIGTKLLVLSGKGGVGKSTVAANLAVSLALAGKKVGLLDVDLHGPSIPKILGLDNERLDVQTADALEPIRVNENLAVMSIGMLLESAEDAVIWRGPLKFKIIQQFLKDVAWGDLDYLVIDSPPGTGDEPLSVAQMTGPGALAVVVSTPQDVAVADVRRSITFCRTLHLDVAGVIENMSGMVCPHCGEAIALFGEGGAEKLAAEMGVPFLGRIPLEPQIVTFGRQRPPLCRVFRRNQCGQGFCRCHPAALESQRRSGYNVLSPTTNKERKHENCHPHG